MYFYIWTLTDLLSRFKFDALYKLYSKKELQQTSFQQKVAILVNHKKDAVNY